LHLRDGDTRREDNSDPQFESHNVSPSPSFPGDLVCRLPRSMPAPHFNLASRQLPDTRPR
jgi:hypothetical protein